MRNHTEEMSYVCHL